ncbi:hypothetical protein [Micromonospora sp. NBC_01412]|uniref:hypothetical protein n=1 Tax=Micromonospora sp. NBC_01412 TaxID=2903590 RepID=UPI003246EC33
MDAGTRPQKTTNRTRILTLGMVTVVILAAVAFGVNYLWQERFGPTTASTDDCELAQQLIDRAQTPPTGKAEAQQWEKEIRQIRYTRIEDEGVSTEVGRYVAWAVVRATGEGERPTAADFEQMKNEATGHCDGSGVDLKIPAIAF